MRTANHPSMIPFYQRHRLALLTLILLLAAAGRVVNIDAESLWVDEGFSYWAIRHADMLGLLFNDVHPPVYFYGLRAWAGVAGITELALRYFSALPGLLSVAVIYHVARELERARGQHALTVVPLLAALLLALADMEIFIAQQVRMYSWHVLWVLLAMWGFLRWARTGERRALVGWALAALLLLYTQYVGLAALAVQGLYALLFLRGRARWTALGVLALVVAAFAPWLLLVVSGQTDNVGTGFNVPSMLESLWNWRAHWFTQQWPLTLLLALLGLVTVVYASGDDGTRPVGFRLRPFGPALLLLAWIVVPVTGAYILNFYTPILMDYRITQITPAVVLLIAFGLGNLRQPSLGLLVAVLVIYGITTTDVYVQRPPWREIGHDAARYAQPGDLALAHVTPSGDWQMVYYYERFMPPGVEWRSLRQWQREQAETYASGLPALLAEHPQVWLMHWSVDRSAFDALAATGHVQTAVITRDWRGSDLNLYRFDQLPPPDAALTAFESGMVLRQAAIIDDRLRLDLWWSADEPPGADYVVSARLLNADGVLIAQRDAQPFNGQRPTSTWAAGEVIYDPHPLQLAEGMDHLPPGAYTAAVLVYRWTPDGIINVPTATGDDFAIIGTLQR